MGTFEVSVLCFRRMRMLLLVHLVVVAVTLSLSLAGVSSDGISDGAPPPPPPPHSPSLGLSLLRLLMEGDFENFNVLFAGSKIELPPTQVKQWILFADLVIDVNELYCQDIRIDDISVSIVPQESPQKLAFTVDVQVDLNCYAAYSYAYGILSGTGNAVIYTSNNKLTTTLALVTSASDFTEEPPSTAQVDSCSAAVDVTNMDFDGGFLASIADAFEGLISGSVEGAINTRACEELNTLGPTALNNVIARMKTEFLDVYLQSISPERADPLYLEQYNLTLPSSDDDDDTVVLVNYRDENNSAIGFWFRSALEQLDAMLAQTVDDEGGPTGTDQDLAINVMLRQNLLNQDRCLSIPLDSLPIDFDTTIFQSQDRLTETVITMNAIKVCGLDTFREFKSVQAIGNYTLQNEFLWEYITLEVNMTVDMKGSTLEDSIFIDPEPDSVVEYIQVSFGADQLDVKFALLLAMVEDDLLDLELGSLLFSKNLLPCFISVLHDMGIAGLEASVGSIRDPVLQGFVSPGIDRVVSSLVEIAFLAYEPTLLRAIPGVFQLTLRDIMDQLLLDRLMADPTTSVCPSAVTDQFDNAEDSTTFIDFRDLLLPPEESRELLGSGTMPYGDIGPFAYAAVKDQFYALDNDGLPNVNELLLRPMTKKQSGREGMIQVSKDMVSIVKQGFEFKLSDLRIHNVDTIASPLTLLKPTNNPNLLDNMATMGDGNLNITLRLLISMDGSSPRQMFNELDLSASVDALDFLASLRAKLMPRAFLGFPLRYLLNLDCWLATLPLWDDNLSGLELVAFVMNLSSLALNATCISCTSSGVSVIPSLVQILQDNGGMELLGKRTDLFANSFLSSDAVQLVLGQRVSEAHQFCPASASYNENAVRSELVLGFPKLPVDSIDTLMYAGAVAGMTAFVVVAESHREESGDERVLSTQPSTDVDDDVRLMDWTDLSGSLGLLGTVLDEAVKALRNFLSSEDDDGELKINSVLSDGLLDNSTLLLNLDIGIQQDDFTVALDRVEIAGLDSFSKFDLLKAVAPHELRNRFALDTLSVSVGLTVAYASSDEPPQRLVADFEVANVTAVVNLVAALDLDKLESLEIGSFFNTTNAVACLLSSGHDLSILSLELEAETYGVPRIRGLMDDTSSVVSATIDAIEAAFGATIRKSIPLIFNTTVKDVLNNWIQSYISEEPNTLCPKVVFESGAQPFVDFRDLLLSEAEARALGGASDSRYGDLFRRAYEIFNKEVLGVDPSSGLSSSGAALVGTLTEGQLGEAGSLFFPGDLVNSDNRVNVGGLDARVTIRLYDAFVENLDTVGSPLSLLEPIYMEPSQLNNTATIGIGEPLRAGVRFMFALVADDSEMKNDMTVSVDVAGLSVAFTALLHMLENALSGFPLRDLLNWHCWLATMPAPPLDARGVRLAGNDPSFALLHLAATVQRLSLNVSCIECTSPGMTRLTEWLATSEASQEATLATNNVLDYFTELLGGTYLQVEIDRLLNDATRRCPYRAEFEANPVPTEYEPYAPPELDSASASVFIALAVVLCALLFGVTATVLITKRIVGRRYQKWLKFQPPEKILLLSQRQSRSDDLDAQLNTSTLSIFTSSAVPLWVRLSIPVVILGNIGLFLSGHLSLGATVVIEASFADEKFTVSNFFEFSMGRSIVEIWNAGGKALAMLMLIFSGVWPYTKQLITLFLWFVPPRVVSVKKRGTILMWLDILGKWSIVDIFVLIVTVAGFRVSVQSPGVVLPDNFYSLDLLVVPMWGLYANMIAQLISQISSHFIIHYHRRIVEAAKRTFENNELSKINTDRTLNDEDGSSQEESTSLQPPPTLAEEKKERLYEHAFARPHRGESDKLVIRRFVNAALVALAAIVCALIVLGCVFPAISLEVLGIVGVLVESGQNFQDATTAYSLFGIIDMLFEQAAFTGRVEDYIGLGSLSVLLVLSVLMVPIAQASCVFFQWFFPLGQTRRNRLSVAVEVLEAWQYAEVYLLAVVIASWQLGPVSEFMINDYCQSLSDTFAQLVYYGVLDENDAQCFRVESSIMSGSYFLFAAAILLLLFTTFVTNAVSQSVRDKEEAGKDAMVLGSDPDCLDEDELNQIRESIRPAPVLFTDKFRWFLCRQDVQFSSGRELSLFKKSGKEGAQPLDDDDDDDDDHEYCYQRAQRSIDSEDCYTRDSIHEREEGSDVLPTERRQEDDVKVDVGNRSSFGSPMLLSGAPPPSPAPLSLDTSNSGEEEGSDASSFLFTNSFASSS